MKKSKQTTNERIRDEIESLDALEAAVIIMVLIGGIFALSIALWSNLK